MPHALQNEIDAVAAAIEQLHHYLSDRRPGAVRDILAEETASTLAGVALEAVADLKRAAQGPAAKAA